MLNILISFKAPPSVELLKALEPHDGGQSVSVLAPEKSLENEVKKGAFDIILIEEDAIRLKTLKALDPRAEVILFNGAIDAVDAVKQGAFACLSSPADTAGVKNAIERIREVVEIRRSTVELEKQIYAKYTFEGVIGKNPRMLELFSFIRRIAPYYRTATVTGETGTGKEMLARALHSVSPVKKEPFIVFNCGGVVENLIESELFGHKRGAFTGAVEDKTGLFEAAGGGSLFLDEVGELPLTIQTHLLRVLQNGEFRRLGSTKTLTAKCRVIAATNKDLKEEVKNGKFREDLYFRLTPLVMELPPLRERKDDIPFLTRFFMEKFNQRTGKKIAGISRPAQMVLMASAWPGNVRELENVIEHAGVMTTETFIRLEDLPPYLIEQTHEPKELSGGSVSLDECVKNHVKRVLDLCENNRTRAAKLLGISRRALIRKLEKYSLS